MIDENLVKNFAQSVPANVKPLFAVKKLLLSLTQTLRVKKLG
jgi:hypothetical protein